ncbi:MAG: hypothetical protein OXU53_07980, partial [Deltaproteobacteria bacterium]|nr:hypothetical protein [Deltaproteobacteria bacterium]
MLTFATAPPASGLPQGEYTFHATVGLSDAVDPPNAYRDHLAVPPSFSRDTGPTFTASFAGPRTIVLTASEALDATTVNPLTFRSVVTSLFTAPLADVPLVPVRYSAGSPPQVAITLRADAADGATYTITPTSAVSDAGGMTYTAGPVMATYDAAAAVPFAASTRSATQTVVTFGAALSGTLDASAWIVAEGTTGRAVTSVAALGADGMPVAAETATPAAGSTPAVTPVISASDGRMTLLITHEALSSTAATPDVAHVRPAAVPAGGHLSTGGAEASPSLAVAADGAGPTFTAERTGTDTFVLTFSEPTMGSIVASDWAVEATGDAPPVGVAVGTLELAAPTAVTLGLAGDAGVNVPHKVEPAAALVGTDGARAIAAATAVRGTDAPVLTSAAFSSANRIGLGFSAPLAEAPALLASSYEVRTPSGVVALTEPNAAAIPPIVPVIYDDETPRSITLVLAADAAAGVVHTITPRAALVGADEPAMSAVGAATAVFNAAAPTLDSALFGSADMITLRFSEPLAEGPAGMASSYTVTIPDGADSDSDPDTVTVSTAAPIGQTATLTLRIAAGDVQAVAAAPTVTYVAPPTRPETPLRDAAGNVMASGSAVAEDSAAPAIEASFTSPTTITLRLSEALVASTVTAANLRVTAPDGTNTPNDLDSAPDVIELAGTNPISYTDGSLVLLIELAA